MKDWHDKSNDSRNWVDFGDFAWLEMKRHGVPNELYQHKVIGVFQSNSWVDVPVQSPPTAVRHDDMAEVAHVVCCGLSEDRVYRVRTSDLKRVTRRNG